MKRRLIYAVFALVLLATAGPLLALALGEATRVLQPILSSRLATGFAIVATLLLVLLVIVRSLTTHHRRRSLRESSPTFAVDASQADLDLEVSPGTPPLKGTEEFFDSLSGSLQCDEKQRDKSRRIAHTPSEYRFRVRLMAYMAASALWLGIIWANMYVEDKLIYGLIGATIGAALGTILALIDLVTFQIRPYVSSTLRQPRTRVEQSLPPAIPRPPRPEHHPKEFTERLAGYLHRDPVELAEPRPYAESKMSFWSRVGQLRWFGPKPAYLLRRLLERIREQVHGRAH